MSAAAVLRTALLDVLRDDLGSALNRLGDGPGVKASVPYAVLGDAIATDWGTKDAAGRELRVSLAIRDAGDTSARVQALAGAAEVAVLGLPAELGGWRVVSVALVRSAVLAEASGRWAAAIDWRVRMLAA